MKKIILKNIFSNWTVYTLLIVVTFIMTPIMLKYLGKNGYGIWLLINSLTGYLGIFGFGIQSSTTKYVAQYMGEDDICSLNILISTTFVTFSVIALIVIFITFFLSVFTNHLFAIPSEYKEIAPYLVLIVGSQIGISFFFATFVQIFSGMQRYEISAVIEIANLIVKSVLIYFFLKSGYGLMSIALITFILELFGKLAYVLFLAHLKIGLEVKIAYFEVSFLKRIFHYSIISFFVSIASKMMRYTDNVIIAAAVSISDISVYGVASRLVQYMQELVKNATNVLSPAASHADVTGSASLRKMALYSSKYTTILIAPIAIGFYLIGDSFFLLWLGKGFSDAYLILVVLTISQVFAAPLYGIASLLYGIEKHGVIAKMVSGEAVLNLVLSLIFVRYLGILGVALGTAIPSILFNLLIFPWKIRDVFEMNLSEYYLHCLMKPFLMAVPFGICLFLYKSAYGCQTWIQFFLGILCSIFIYSLVVYQFELKPLVKERFGTLAIAFRSLTSLNS